ncbi:MAG: hypothetical protein M1836_005039 [Candelina mexicana]|nr:MAG: hypothetical protein M1836_005039 [Candelina mexicana]
MLKRFSSVVRRDKTKDDSHTNGDASAKRPNNAHRKSSSFAFPKRERKEPDPPEPAPQQEQDDTNVFSQFAQLIHAARRPLPTQTGDGSYIEHEVSTTLWQDLKQLGFKDINTLKDVISNKASAAYQDDKTYLMERVIQNVMFPQLGAANTPYARSVIPNTIQPGALPDPGVIFDSVFTRKEFTPHPNNVSSILFYWASLIIHDCFQTDHADFNMSQTSSYLDLSPLYGDVQEDQDMIRTFKDGKLKPDCFAEQRLLGFPPGCGVLLIMFNRFHNYVVEQLAVINEGGRFTKPREGLPQETAEKAWAQYDNDLFQTGRLIVCGLYINITLLDYLRTIVNLNRSNTTWTLDPRVEMGKVFGHDGTSRGTGNQVSAEFNIVYRWHSCISDKDDKWTQELFKELFGKPAHELSMQELLMGLGKWEHSLDKDPFKRDFAHLKRESDGKFNDDDLVEIITSGIEDTAGAFGANNVPSVLRAVSILGMQQARKWNTGSLNEFRKFFGLKPHETFEDINSDPYVADQLRNLYEHPDFVEMYPGVVAEEAKVPMVPGVGITPTFTISRAILSDAVVLVRGDRFYTIDYHPKNLTNWGYNEVQYDLNVEQGCVFYKLFLRAFPNHFKGNSVYAHYPMTIPSENKKILTNLGRASHYSWDRPARIAPRVNLTSYGAARYILDHGQDFKVTWGDALEFLMGQGGRDFMLSGDTSFNNKQRQTMSKPLYKDKWHQHIKDFYEDITLRLLHEKSCKIAGVNQVDITRDVGNLAHVHFAAQAFSLPLKDAENPLGIFSEHEMYMVLAIIFVCIFFDLDPAKSFPLRLAAKAVTDKIGKLVEANVKSVYATGWVSGIVDPLRENHSALNEYGVHMIRKLLESGLGPVEIAWSQVLPTAVAMVANQAQVFTQLLDYYLSPPGSQHLPEINRIAKLDTAEADDLLLHYCMEGIRLNGTFGLYREAHVDAEIDNDGHIVKVKKGDKCFVSFVGAARDPNIFPSPDTVRLDRPMSSYIHYGSGPHQCLGEAASKVALTAMLKVVGRLDNLRRAPGPQGELKKIPREGGFYIYMREDWGSMFPFPTTMKVCWDGELMPRKKG